MFNWKKIAILLLTGSVLCAFATNRELQLKGTGKTQLSESALSSASAVEWQ